MSKTIDGAKITGEELDDELDGEQGNDTGEQSGGESSGGSAAQGNASASKEGKTFTQAQVNRMMTREKNQGRNAAFKELGIDPKDAKTMAAVKAYLESQKTPEQKDAEAQLAQQSELDAANQRVMVAEAKAEAMMLGIKTNYVDDAVALALSKVQQDDGTDLKTVLGELKTKYPIWFEDAGEDGKDAKERDKSATGRRGTGSSVKQSKDDKNGKEQSMGARLAARRTQSRPGKSSYWTK